jgi:hypothetical protein
LWAGHAIALRVDAVAAAQGEARRSRAQRWEKYQNVRLEIENFDHVFVLPVMARLQPPCAMTSV